MLVLRRSEGQWVEITHESGDTLRIRVYNIRSRSPGQLDLAFDDASRHFKIERVERPGAAAPRVSPSLSFRQ
jgi:hypothetical protein